MDDAALAAALGRLADTAANEATRRVEEQIPALLDVLDAAGVPAIVLKGPVTRSRLYGPDETRTVADVDLLVPARSHRRARSAMAPLGYTRVVTGIHSDVLRSSHGDVDLHLALPFTTVPLARAFACLHRHTDHLAVGGRDVAVLDVPAHVVHLALHAAQNSFEPDHRTFDEWRRGLASMQEADRTRAAEVAQRLGVSPVWEAALAALEPGADLTELASKLPRRRAAPTAEEIVAFVRSPLALQLRWRALRDLSRRQFSDAYLAAWRHERGLEPVPRGTFASTRAKLGRFGRIAAEQASLARSPR